MRSWAPLRTRLLFVYFSVSQAIEGSYVPSALIPVRVNFHDAHLLPRFSVAPNPAGDVARSQLPVIGGQPALSTSSQAAPIIPSPTPVSIGLSSTPGVSTPPVLPLPPAEFTPRPVVSSPSPAPRPVDSAPPSLPSPSLAVVPPAGTVGDIGQPEGGSAQTAQPANPDNTNTGSSPAPVPVAPLVDLDGSPDKIAGEPSFATDPNACSCACACPYVAFGIPAVSIPPYTPEPLPQFLASTFSTVVTPVMMSSNVPAVTPNAPAVSPTFQEAGTVGSLTPAVPVAPPPIQSTSPIVEPSPVPTFVPTPVISPVPIVFEPSTTAQAAVTPEPEPVPAEDFDIDSVELHSALTMKIGG